MLFLLADRTFCCLEPIDKNFPFSIVHQTVQIESIMPISVQMKMRDRFYKLTNIRSYKSYIYCPELINELGD